SLACLRPARHRHTLAQRRPLPRCRSPKSVPFSPFCLSWRLVCLSLVLAGLALLAKLLPWVAPCGHWLLWKPSPPSWRKPPLALDWSVFSPPVGNRDRLLGAWFCHSARGRRRAHCFPSPSHKYA